MTPDIQLPRGDTHANGILERCQRVFGSQAPAPSLRLQIEGVDSERTQRQDDRGGEQPCSLRTDIAKETKQRSGNYFGD